MVDARYAKTTKGEPTFLEPRQGLTVLNWSTDRAHFGQPEAELKGKRICVTGQIAEHNGTPEVVAKDPKQIMKE